MQLRDFLRAFGRNKSAPAVTRPRWMEVEDRLTQVEQRLAVQEALQPREAPATTPALSNAVEPLLTLVNAQQLAVQRALGERELHRQRRETARRLVLGRVFDCLDALARLLRLKDSPLDQRLEASLEGLLDRVGKLLQPQVGWYRTLLSSTRPPDRHYNFYRPAHREAVWELISELDCALLEVGGSQYLRVCLEQERTREGNADDAMRWSSFHDVEKLVELQDRLKDETASKSPGQHAEVVELLARLYQARSDADREHRAQENLRVVRLRWTCRILAVALVGRPDSFPIGWPIPGRSDYLPWHWLSSLLPSGA